VPGSSPLWCIPYSITALQPAFMTEQHCIVGIDCIFFLIIFVFVSF
jgi:hypothetical protein